MTEYIEQICLKLKATTQDIKWEHLCFLIGEKIYCMCNLEPPFFAVFKVLPEQFTELTARPGIEQASHMARNQWVAVNEFSALSPEEWQYYIAASYRLILGKLSKKKQQELLGEAGSGV